jgi:hypothetical protein
MISGSRPTEELTSFAKVCNEVLYEISYDVCYEVSYEVSDDTLEAATAIRKEKADNLTIALA